MGMTLDLGADKIKDIEMLKAELMEMKNDMTFLKSKKNTLESKINETLGSMNANHHDAALSEEGKPNSYLLCL